MSDFDFDDDDQYGAGANDSDLVKQLRRQLKALAKERDELKTTNGQLQATTRSASLKDILASKNANPKLAAFMADVEPTEVAVQQWLTDYADVFNVAVSGSEPAPEAQQAETPLAGGFAPTADDATVRAFQAAQAAMGRAQAGATQTVAPSKAAESALFAAAGEAQSADQFFQSLRGRG